MVMRRALRPIVFLAISACFVLAGGAVSTAWGAAKTAAPATPTAKVDLNTASVEQLEELPGIGEAYAKKIVEGRPYKTVKDLKRSGIPASKLEKLVPLVCVKAVPSKAAKVARTAGGAASTAGEPTTKMEKPAAAGEKPAAIVDLNTASQQQLEDLPGIGPAYAKKIIEGRPYKSVADLTKSGIPEYRLKKVLPLVTVNIAEPAVHPSRETARVARRSTTSSGNLAGAATAQTPPAKGMVWVNTASKVYHAEGSRWYGKTKAGKWMTEEDAIKEGDRAAKEKD
jgi:competence protein ComEA